jgi:hypothetical protein
MHQVLRLLYADQLSPVEHIFKFEPFDPPSLRDVVGRLLCGAYDGEFYNNEVRLKGLIRDFDQINAQLRSLLSVLGRTEQAHTLEWIAGQKSVIEEERNRVQQEIEVTEQQIYTAGAADQLTLRVQEEAYHEVQRLQRELSRIRAERDALTLAISDSDLFIHGLQRKLSALDDSKSVAEALGDIRFRTCPACYATVEEETEEHKCHLCKTPLEKGPAHNRIVRLINESGRQLKQSLVLQQNRRNTVAELDANLARLGEEWQHASRRLSQTQSLPSTELRAKLRGLNREAGYLDRKAEDLESKSALANEINDLSGKKERLNAEISRLRNRNEILRAAQSKRLSQAYTLIESEVRSLLHNDLPRQDAFIVAKRIEFDFGANSVGVDGQAYFSASSRVVLKSSFFVGFLLAATKDRAFRHPRFCMLDTIEDKGMEQIRSHNFQRLIVKASKACQVEHQIIFATAMIAPELDVPEYAIGDPSTLVNPTIKLARPSGSSSLV